MLYAMLVAALLLFGNEIAFVIREWWRDVSLRREIARRGAYLREGWTFEGTERFRAGLAKGRDRKARGLA